MTELWRRSAGDLARMIAGRETTSAEVVEAHLQRIEAVNPKLNAIVRLLADEARAGARAADAAVAAGAALGPLHGVPITVKENIDMAGLPTTQGVPALAGAVAASDAPVVERMRAAGAIPIGRTNLPDFAFRVHTDSALHGLTRNPWNRERTTGGSSGGDGSALAAGMAALGLGNDIGGSLRNPANACGIASIRPSLGRVPAADSTSPADRPLAAQLMAVQGPMARRVADVRLGLTILSGAHPRDPWSMDPPAEPAAAQPARVAVVEAPPGDGADPVVADAVRRAADALSDAGYAVSAVCPPDYAEAVDLWARFIVGDFDSALDLMISLMGEGGRDFLLAVRAEIGAQPDARALSALLARRDTLARNWSMFMADHPLVLTPTWTRIPFEHGWDAASPQNAVETLQVMRPVVPANLLGLPSACVPVSVDPESGMPVGVLVTGRHMHDLQCLAAAEVIEGRSEVRTPVDPVW